MAIREHLERSRLCQVETVQLEALFLYIYLSSKDFMLKETNRIFKMNVFLIDDQTLKQTRCIRAELCNARSGSWKRIPSELQMFGAGILLKK